MDKGLWVVFEGPDGAGKSTTMAAVAARLRVKLPRVQVVETAHPGATSLGAQLRAIIKGQADVDPLAAQLLMAADHVSFKQRVLLPALERGALVLSDRCNLISGMAYGPATGLDAAQVSRLLSIVAGPRIDAMYVLSCDRDTQEERLSARGRLDRFEQSGVLDMVNEAYATMLTRSTEAAMLLNSVVALDNVRYVHTTLPAEEVADALAADVLKRWLATR